MSRATCLMQKKYKAAKVLYIFDIRCSERCKDKTSIACLSLQARPGAPRGPHRAPTGLQTPGPAPPGRHAGARRTDAHQSGGETGEEGLVTITAYASLSVSSACASCMPSW